MPTPSYSQPQPAASDLFTNRHRARSQFEAALEEPQTISDYRVLVWTGPGGQGKTALLEEFERVLKHHSEIASRLSAPHPSFALIDFNNASNRSIATALLSVREQIGETGGLRLFPAFDTACLRYMLMAQPGMNIQDVQARMFSTGSDALDTFLQFVEASGEIAGLTQGLPGFSLLSKFGTRMAGKAGRALHTWWTQSGKGIFADIEELSQDALLRKLPTYLGSDLRGILADGRSSRMVIMLDTYEALWRGYGLRDGPGAQRIDDWVRLLVQDSPGVLFVIAGRDRLHWNEIDASAHWDRVIQDHSLDGLTRLDAETLLTRWDVSEHPIKHRIVTGAYSHDYGELDPADSTAEAYLPFYLELQARTYWNIRASGGTPKPQDFGGRQPEILARFMEHLDTETDRLLRLASYPSTLDPEILDMLAERFLGGRANADWSRVYARSLVSEERDGIRLLHRLLRDALQEREYRERPELYRDIHQSLFAWFAERSGATDSSSARPPQERAVLAAMRHLSRVDAGEAVLWAHRQMQRLDNAGCWRTLEEACQFVLPLAEAAYGTENERTTAILAWLAGASASNARYADAMELYKRALTIYEKACGPEHPSTAATLSNLALIYSDLGRYAEAEDLYNRVLAIDEKTLEPEHPSRATTLGNLARVYSDTGRYVEAEHMYNRVRAIQEKTLGPEHPSTATMLNNLAHIYSDTGRYTEAAELYNRVRAIQEKTLGPEHPSTAATLANLARVYGDTGRYAEAESLYDHARTIQENTLGPEHPSTATTLANLAGVRSDTGRYAEAEDLYNRVRLIQEKTLGPEHPSTSTTLNNLALVYSKTGRYAEAEDLYDRVRATEEKTLGPEHPATATTLHNLARIYSDTGRYDKAEELYNRAHAIQGKTLGEEHPSTTATLANLAHIYSDTGRYAQANELYNRVRTIQERTLGSDHPSTATTLANLAGVYRDTGRYAEAEELYDRVRTIQEETLGPEHPSTATTLANLAGIYRDTGRYAEAEELYNRARAMEEKALGPEHPSTAMTLCNLAGVYRNTARQTEAEHLLQSGLQSLSAKLPARHPWVARSLVERGKLHAACGRPRQARDDFQTALSAFDAAGVLPEYRWAREAREGIETLPQP